MTFNRGKFSAGTKMNSVQKMQQDAEKHDKKFYDDSNRVSYHQIKEGRNIFRIAPAHDPNDSPYIAVRFTNLDTYVDEYDNTNQKTGNKVWKRKKCYISTQHGPRDNHGNSILKSDIVEVYIEHLNKKLKAEYPIDKERETIAAPIRGYWKDRNYQWGIKPETKQFCYAWDETGELKLLELSKRWFNELQDIIMKASGDSNVAIDIFSHIDNGFPLVIDKEIKKEQGKRAKTEYKISKLDPDMVKRESWDDFFDRTKVTDRQLKDLLEKKSLKAMFYENYTREEFEKVGKGLRRFDANNNYNLFSNKEFVDEVRGIHQQINMHVPVSNDESQDEEKGESEDEQTDDVTTGVQTGLTIQQALVELIDHVTIKYGNAKYLPKLDDDQVFKWYEMLQAGEELPIIIDQPDVKQRDESMPKDDGNDLPWEMDDKSLGDAMDSLSKD